MRVLITGASGFVGQYLVQYLESINVEVIPTARLNCEKKIGFVDMDVMKNDQIREVLNRFRPTHIVHLAGISSVSESWKQKETTFSVNVIGTLRLLDAVREVGINCRVLTIGSSEEYGFVSSNESPIKEDNPLRPMSPYGISKLSAGMLGQQYAKAYQMDIIHARAFNHIGPKQSLGFVTQDFASQIVEIENGLREPVLYVGNLEAVRDFTDVRDIVKAYSSLLHKGKKGNVYNVSSGIGVKIKDILSELLVLARASIRIESDIMKMRPSDVPYLIGDSSKITSDTGWRKEISLSDSLSDILNYYRNLKKTSNENE